MKYIHQSGERVKFWSHSTRKSFSLCTLRAFWQTPGKSGVASVCISPFHSDCSAAIRPNHLWHFCSRFLSDRFSVSGHLLILVLSSSVLWSNSISKTRQSSEKRCVAIQVRRWKGRLSFLPLQPLYVLYVRFLSLSFRDRPQTYIHPCYRLIITVALGKVWVVFMFCLFFGGGG